MGYDCGPAPDGPLPPYQGPASREQVEKWEKHNAFLEEVRRKNDESLVRQPGEFLRPTRPVITLTALLLGAFLGIAGWNLFLIVWARL